MLVTEPAWLGIAATIALGIFDLGVMVTLIAYCIGVPMPGSSRR